MSSGDFSSTDNNTSLKESAVYTDRLLKRLHKLTPPQPGGKGGTVERLRLRNMLQGYSIKH